jgi:oxygen-independent coproporphyrinogen-3 oxidase
MMNALRLADGFDVTLFLERTGLQMAAVDRPLVAAEAKGLIERDHVRIRPTALGRRFLNDLLQLFLPEGREGRRENGEGRRGKGEG